MKKQHVCDTEHPQRPCCWAARNAELKAMRERDASGETARAQQEHTKRIEAEGGFIVKGVD